MAREVAMPNWLDALGTAFSKVFDPASAEAVTPPPSPRRYSDPLRPPRTTDEGAQVPIVDTRARPATRKFTGRYPAQAVANVTRQSLETGVDPNVALGVALQEGQLQGYGYGPTYNLPRDLRAHAARASGQGAPLPEQLRRYNGTGQPPRGFNTYDRGGYGQHVLNVADRVIRQSPAVQALVERERSAPFVVNTPRLGLIANGNVTPDAEPKEYVETVRDLDLKRTQPRLLRR